MTMKHCCVCDEDKPLDSFPQDRSRRDGRMSRCRACDNARSRRYYEQNAEKVATRTRRHRQPKARLCLNCKQSATSSRHWFCDTCRAAGARRKRRTAPPASPCHKCGRHHAVAMPRRAPSVRVDADEATKERWIQDYLQWSREIAAQECPA